jgi:hypothetical protein
MPSNESSNVAPCQCRVCQTGTATEVMHYHHQIRQLLTRLTEPQRRWYVGTLSQAPGSPGDRQLAIITGLDAKTIRRGRREIETGFADLPADRQRQVGGGQKAAEKKTRRSKR